MLTSIKREAYETSRQLKERLDSGVSQMMETVSKLPVTNMVPLTVTNMHGDVTSMPLPKKNDQSKSDASEQVNTSRSLNKKDLEHDFVQELDKMWTPVYKNNQELLEKGRLVSEELIEARRYVTQESLAAKTIRDKMSVLDNLKYEVRGLRTIVEEICVSIEVVEQILIEKTEEVNAMNNARFMSHQQRELDLLERQRVLAQDQRLLELVEEKRMRLSNALENDLEAYRQKGIFNASQPIAPSEEQAISDVGVSLDGMALDFSIANLELESFYDDDNNDGEKENAAASHHLDG